MTRAARITRQQVWYRRPPGWAWVLAVLPFVGVYIFAESEHRSAQLVCTALLGVVIVAYLWALRLWPEAMLHTLSPAEYSRRKHEAQLRDAYVELFVKAERAVQLPEAMIHRANIVALNQYLSDLRDLAHSSVPTP